MPKLRKNYIEMKNYKVKLQNYYYDFKKGHWKHLHALNDKRPTNGPYFSRVSWLMILWFPRPVVTGSHDFTEAETERSSGDRSCI